MWNTALIDRDQERQALDQLLDTARAGLSGSLVLRGEPGIGKTALLDYAIGRADGMQVARLLAVESEMELGFATLHQLLVPFLDRFGELPTPQRDALGSAFGLIAADTAAPDRFLVGLAVLTLLAAAAAEQALLVIVDDAQWLDDVSADVLAFVARRVYADGIVLLFAVREPAGKRLPLEGLTELWLPGLPDRDARALLTTVAGDLLDNGVVARLVAETQGNPLALIELPGELTAGHLSSGELLPDPLPMGSLLQQRFLRQVRALPADTQALLLLAAADPSGDPALLWRAADGRGLSIEAAAPAETERLLTLLPRIAFRHPLIRAAIYHGAPATQRRLAHQALALASDPELDPDRRAWHLAAASAGRDEEVAAELQRCADRASHRGGHAATAAFLARAAELTPDPGRQAARRLAAAQANLVAGAPGRVLTLVEQAAPSLPGPLERARGAAADRRDPDGPGPGARYPPGPARSRTRPATPGPALGTGRAARGDGGGDLLPASGQPARAAAGGPGREGGAARTGADHGWSAPGRLRRPLHRRLRSGGAGLPPRHHRPARYRGRPLVHARLPGRR